MSLRVSSEEFPIILFGCPLKYALFNKDVSVYIDWCMYKKNDYFVTIEMSDVNCEFFDKKLIIPINSPLFNYLKDGGAYVV